MFGRATIRLGIGPHSSFFNILYTLSLILLAFGDLTLLVGQQEGHPACKN